MSAHSRQTLSGTRPIVIKERKHLATQADREDRLEPGRDHEQAEHRAT
jgi:hypothetical protein